MVSTLKVNKIQIPNSDSDVISLDTSSGNITIPKPITFSNTLSGTGMDLVATVSNTSIGATTFEFSMDYDYNNFLVVIERISGTSTSGSENLDVKFKFNGAFDGGQSNPYYCEASVQGSSSYRNTNATDNGELFFTNKPSKRWTGFYYCTNFKGEDKGLPNLNGFISGATGSSDHGSFTFVTGLHTVYDQKITALRYAFTNGNMDVVQQKIYGIS